MSKNPAFVRNAHDFADELSRVLTATITHTPLRGEPLEGRDTVYLRFRPPNEDANFRFVELENDCWVSIYQRLVPSEQDSRMVHTAQYSYTHSLGPNPDHDWLVRYDYDPEKVDDEDYEYPISHVHVNAKNATYDEFIKSIKDKYTPLSDIHLPTERISLEDFIKHLIVKFKIPVLHGKIQREALEILDENRLRFEEKRTR